MKSASLVVFWLVAIVAANLLINHYGPSATPYVAFGLIGADLTVRDLLHVQWERRQLWLRMGLLILAGAVVTYVVDTSTQRIVIASVIAFTAAGITDTVVYATLHKVDRSTRVNVSNIVSAAVDSLLFPTIAFSGVLWGVSFNQWFAKIAGGVVWLILLRRVLHHRPAVTYTGYFPKFQVVRNSTGDVVTEDTFTLIPSHDPHARRALLAYAGSCAAENPILAEDLRSLARK